MMGLAWPYYIADMGARAYLVGATAVESDDQVCGDVPDQRAALPSCLDGRRLLPIGRVRIEYVQPGGKRRQRSPKKKRRS